MLLTVTVALALIGGGERFENRAFGHTVRVPAGWTAQLRADGTTDVSSYRGAPLDTFARPPARHVQVILADYGRAPCPRGAVRDGGRIELGPRVSFEGFTGHTVAFCRGGHSLQAFVPAGDAVPAWRRAQARAVVASLRLTPRAHVAANRHSMRVLGRSLEGRAIRVFRKGNPRSGRRVLVVGCVHGNECAGTAVTQRLVSLLQPLAADLWVLQDLNPDGSARGTRGNARGVDLNRDFDTFSQREGRIARRLILRLRPDVTIWFHQPQAVVRAWGRSRAAARRYARLAREPYRSLEWPRGAATRWQNGLGMTSFVVELPPGELSPASAERHARAVLRLADPLCCVTPRARATAAHATRDPLPRLRRPPRPRFEPVRWRRSRSLGLHWSGRLVEGVQLPPAAETYFTWDPALRRSPNRAWRRVGSDRLVRVLLRVLSDFSRAHPEAPRIGVGDLSRPRGGDFGIRFGPPGHVSHQNGLDADLYYPRLDRVERPPRTVRQIDRRLAQDLVDRFVRAGALRVFVGPRTGLTGPPDVVQPLVRHDDHLHVRLR